MTTQQPMAPLALTWLPEPYSCTILAVGRYGWDAVRMPRLWGERTLLVLGEATGAVIEDDLARQLYWLIPVGSITDWQPSAGHGIEVFRAGSYITVPGRMRPGAPRWRIPPTLPSYLTDPNRIRSAIDRALGPCRREAP
jgi:hypothetical protein